MTEQLEITIPEFMAAFYPDADEQICLRVFEPKGAPKDPKRGHNYDTSRAELAADREAQDELKRLNRANGIYFLVNAGGQSDAEITRYNAFFVENDSRSLEEQHAALDAAPLHTSIRVETKKSVHAYWLVAGDCTEADWREIQARLIAYFDGDNQNKNPSRCMRLPHFNHVTYNGEDEPLTYKRVEIVQFDPTQRFTVAEMLAAFPAPKVEAEKQSEKKGLRLKGTITDSRFASYEERHAELKRLIKAHPTAKQNDRGIFDCQGICHDGVGSTALMFNPATDAVHCNKGCDYAAVLRAFGLPDGYLPSLNSPNSLYSSEAGEQRAAFPTLSEKALYGLAGDFVRTILPHTEADGAALLVQLLTAVGNVVGRTAYYVADGARHYTNLFALIVGNTGAAKGSALAHVLNMVEPLDAQWTEQRTDSGLSSGEGLVKAVDDTDNPTDKRLLVLETEFASVLHMNKREGNTLSTVMRNLWDKGKAGTMTKKDAVRTTNAHVSIIGHITPDELGRYMTQTEIANGYANRFLFACVRRSKDLPEGGSLSEAESERLKERFLDVIEFAQGVDQMKRDDEAAALWQGVYGKLAQDRPGNFGKVTARARAQVLRLSCLYALLDCSAVVKREHLEAALALWQFCEESALYVFGGSVLSDKAQRLLDAIREAGAEGMNKTQMFELFSKKVKKAELNELLAEIASTDAAYSNPIKTEGRDEERWFAATGEEEGGELSEFGEESTSIALPNSSNSPNSPDVVGKAQPSEATSPSVPTTPTGIRKSARELFDAEDKAA
jgi:hypothetical protein